MSRSRTAGLMLSVVLAGGLVACDSSDPAPARTATTSAAAAPTTSAPAPTSGPPRAGAADRLAHLLTARQVAAQKVRVEQSSPFSVWHRSAVINAKACHALLAGLRRGPWPAAAQALVTKYARLVAAECAGDDAQAAAKTLKAYLNPKVVLPPDLLAKTQAAKLALFTALGL